MSIAIRIEPRGRLAVLQTIDAVSPADWDRAVTALVTNPDFRAGCPILVDRRREDTEDRSGSLQRMVELLAEHSAVLGASRWAMVVDRSNTGAYRVRQSTWQFPAIRQVEIEAFVRGEVAIRWLLGENAEWTTLAAVCVWFTTTTASDRFVENRLVTVLRITANPFLASRSLGPRSAALHQAV
jgi:hypothetical protein